MRLFGSSPLSRGIPVKFTARPIKVRIIPALAGNTSLFPFPEIDSQDHPRSRGEYLSQQMCNCCRPGSSPLSRGIPYLRGRNARRCRIIPALAGNTRVALQPCCIPQDHPRSRREYTIHLITFRCNSGSSPLSRGIHPNRPKDSDGGRIIPALAGNTNRNGT